MELAALPGDPREAGLASLLQSRVIIRHDHLDAVQASINQVLEERPPVDFRFRERNADP